MKIKVFFSLKLFTLLLTAQTIFTHSTSLILNITTQDELLNSLDSNKPTIIMAHMDHCPFCNIIEPLFEKQAEKKANKKISFAKVNGPKLHLPKHIKNETKGNLSIPGYPVFVFVKNKKVIDVLVGGNDKKLTEKITGFVKSSKNKTN